MSATARNYPGSDVDSNEMDDTIVYVSESKPGSGNPAQALPRAYDPAVQPRPIGSPDMPTPQGQHRYTYSSGARPLDGYTIKRAIGRGGFGEVYYATSDSGKEVALKLILRNLDVERRGVVQCMNLKCPNLLQVFDLRGNDSGEVFVIMEYVAGPSLANVLAEQPHGMPVAEVRAWLKGLVEGVAYLHDHGIVHRDLKPANLFMEEGLVKIGDYGLAKLITPSQGSEHSESIGTCHYMAPEIASGKYHKPIDVYAIGVILFEMLTGRVPFEGETVGEVLMKHLTARPDVSELPEPFRTIVAKALAKDPNQRPQRVYDLLPADDAPRAPNVRFIGDGKTAPPSAPSTPDDSVLRIGADSSVFYIGPETRPPRPPLNQRLRAVWQRPRPRPQPAPRPAQVRRAEPTRAERLAAIHRASAPAQAVVPPVAPVPYPLPSPRVRLAELTSSMLWAAPLAAVLSVPVGLLPGLDGPVRPERVAFVFVMTLLGVWGALIPTKLMEGHGPDPSTRRFIHLASGALVGLAGMGIASWVELGRLPGWNVAIHPALVRILDTGPYGGPGPANYAIYFGLISLLAGTPWMSARYRKRRFRVWSVLKAGAVAGVLGLFWPFPQPWGLGVGVLTAVITQFVSPWSAQAAAYARYAAKQAKRDRKQQRKFA